MSIDLSLVGPYSVASRDLLKSIHRCMHELTEVQAPELRLFEVSGGNMVEVKNVMIGRCEEMLVLSWDGTDDGVGLVTFTGENGEIELTLSIGATRSDSEYVLGLMTACALQRIWNVPIQDNNQFWGDNEFLDTDSITEIFRRASGTDFLEICRNIMSNFNGP